MKTMHTRIILKNRIIWLLMSMLLASIGNAQIMYRIQKKETSSTLSNGFPIYFAVGDSYPLISLEESGAILKLKFGAYAFYIPRSACTLIPDNEVNAEIARYNKDVAQLLPKIINFEREKNQKQASTPNAPASPSAPAQQPDPQFYWDVTIGINTTWTRTDFLLQKHYESGTNYYKYGPVKASTRQEAEAIAKRDYRHNLNGSKTIKFGESYTDGRFTFSISTVKAERQ